MYRLIRLLLPVWLFALLGGPACRKQSTERAAGRRDLIQQAKALVDSVSAHGYAVNYRASQPKTIRWDLAQSISVGKATGLAVPVVFKNDLLMRASFTGPERFHIDYLTRLFFLPDSAGGYLLEVVTNFPDSSYFNHPTGPFTGIRMVEDWYGHLIEQRLYTPDGKVKRYIPTNVQPDALNTIETCYEIDGYNYSPATGETYTWTEDAGCTVNYIEDNPGGGGDAPSAAGSTGSGNASVQLTVLPGNSVIKNIKAYFQCFTNVGGTDHTYSVTVCVDQPSPGMRTPWSSSGSGSSGSSGGGNPVNAGHTFFILTETYGNTTITRNVGFFPATNVNPIDNTSQGTLNDDETDDYNIGGSFVVNNAQFFTILNFISQGNAPGYLYNLNTNNCTTFVIDGMAQAGINLPRTIGTWLGGAGNDPGDLGEDLREDNVPGMTLNSSGGTSVSHVNVGQCN